MSPIKQDSSHSDPAIEKTEGLDGISRKGAERHLAEKIIATVRGPLVALAPDQQVVYANSAFFNTFQVTPDETIGHRIQTLGNGQWDFPRLRELLDRVLSQDDMLEDFEVDHAFPELGRRIMVLNARRIDSIELILLTFEDVTDRRRHEEEMRYLVREQRHRANNLLAVVKSIARLLSKQTRPEDFAEAFDKRLNSLAAAQDVMIETRGKAVPLDRIVDAQLVHLGDDFAERIDVSGEHLHVTADAAQAIGMAIYELSTNALKYGAFSNATGRVQVNWKLQTVDGSFVIEWLESDGPPVSPPERDGFGREMIERMASLAVGGDVDFSFHASGVRWRLEAPADRVVAQ